MRALYTLAIHVFVVFTATAQQANWVTIKGQVVASASDAKIALENGKKPINVTADKQHCEGKGALLPIDRIVNPKNNGVKNVLVYLRPADEKPNSQLPKQSIHPDYLNPKPKALVIDQPCCHFEPRVTVARQGDTLEIKNSSPVNHNARHSSQANGEANPGIPSGGSFTFPKPLVAEKTPIDISCTIHPWMKCYVYVFDHPYTAVTDAEGKFEIKNAPAGKFHIVYRHEGVYHKGADGKFGFPINIAPDKASGSTMELKPAEFEFPKN